MPRPLPILLSALLLTYFWHSPVLFPFRLLVVLLHEMGHAVGAVLTGGRLLTIAVGIDEGGHAVTQGGSAFVVLNSGYLGSLAWGLGFLSLARSPRAAQALSALLSATFLVLTLGWIRPLVSAGFLVGLLAAAGLAALSRTAFAAIALRALGVFSVLYALGDIVDDVLRRPGSPSDAAALAVLTGIPTIVWGVSWIAASVATIWRVRRWLW